jgi:hypothetical protein
MVVMQCSPVQELISLDDDMDWLGDRFLHNFIGVPQAGDRFDRQWTARKIAIDAYRPMMR